MDNSIPESEERRRGQLIAEMLSLKPLKPGQRGGHVRNEPMYQITDGTKTALGLYRSIHRVVMDGE